MQRAVSLMFTLCLLHGCGGTEDDFTTEYAAVNPQDEADAGVDDADETEEADDEDAGVPDIEGTETSTMTWDEVCEYWEDVYNDGITAVCNRILDNKGVRRGTIIRRAAMRLCRRKVQEAIDEAVCTIIDVITPDDPEEETDAGEEDTDAGEEEEEEDAGEEEEDTDAGVSEEPEEEQEDPCDYDPYGC